MRVTGDKMPSNTFSIEQRSNHSGYVLVRFYENAKPYTKETEFGTMKDWVYDEYVLELQNTATLKEDIINRYDFYMQQAKLQELAKQPFNPIEYQQQVIKSERARADIDFIAVMTGVDLI